MDIKTPKSGGPPELSRDVPDKRQKETQLGPEALIPWEAEATLQETFIVKVKGVAPEGIEIIDLVEDLIEPLVVEAIVDMKIHVTSPEEDTKDAKGDLVWAKDTAPLRATFEDKAGQILTLDGINRKGETELTRMFTQCVLPKLISVIAEASYHVIGMN